MSIHTKQSGFTLVELLIATVIFSIILLGGTSAIIQIGRMYYKGLLASQTQATARSVTEALSRPIQFSGSDVRSDPPVDKSGIQTGAYCIGDQRFTYGLNAQIDDSVSAYTADHKTPHALWQDTHDATLPCTSVDLISITSTTPGKELLGQRMRLGRTFNVSGSNNVWTITAPIIYGDDDLVLPDGDNPTGCRGLADGAQWCAVSNLTTNVFRRIN